MRVFFCSFLTAGNLDAYDGSLSRVIAESGGLLRAVPRATLHVTYAFIPYVTDERLGPLGEQVASRVSACPAFEIAIGAPSLLSAGREARLVHAPVVEGVRELSDLVREIGHALRMHPDIAFKPTTSFHVTLARFRRGARRADADGLKAALAALPQRVTNRIDDVHLVASELTPVGPKYTTLSAMALGPS